LRGRAALKGHISPKKKKAYVGRIQSMEMGSGVKGKREGEGAGSLFKLLKLA